MWRESIALRWGVGGLAAAPLSVLLHEFGHYLAYVALGLPGVTLHYASVSWTGSSELMRALMERDYAAAASIAPLSQVAVGMASGPVATYLVVAACCCLCAKWFPHPLFVAVGCLSNVRILGPLSVVVLQLLGTVRSTCDECVLSALTGLPLALLVAPGLVSLVGAGWWLARYFPGGSRRLAAASMVAGFVVGTTVYGAYVGPLLLS